MKCRSSNLILSLCAYVFLFSGVICAQTDSLLEDIARAPYDISIDQAGFGNDALIDQTGAAHRNKAVIEQVGTANHAAIIQVYQARSDGANVAYIKQNGMNNQVDIKQSGSGNRSKTIQNGTGNHGVQNIAADMTSTNLLQQGNNNSSTQVIPSSGFNHTVLQRGHNNQVLFIETDKRSRQEATIIQEGNGMQTVIIHGH
ncbi:MAG: hypothetical protein JW795_14465 [Chitinivibrionales bacterium]|nr:hypothetical protein [Chitinivibrionales bacterium]